MLIGTIYVRAVTINIQHLREVKSLNKTLRLVTLAVLMVVLSVPANYAFAGKEKPSPTPKPAKTEPQRPNVDGKSPMEKIRLLGKWNVDMLNYVKSPPWENVSLVPTLNLHRSLTS